MKACTLPNLNYIIYIEREIKIKIFGENPIENFFENLNWSLKIEWKLKIN